jgi:hypothetical protein
MTGRLRTGAHEGSPGLGGKADNGAERNLIVQFKVPTIVVIF